LTTSCGVIAYCEDIIVFDSSTIDIKEITSDMLKVYPNPSKGVFNINFKSEKDISINVFDISGRQVFFKEFINSKELMVNISDKLPGTYILKILIDEVQYQKRIINTK
jgi:hypothetical protein